MSMTKDAWIDRQMCICEDFASGEIDRGEAMAQLRRMGFDEQESSDLLDGAVA